MPLQFFTSTWLGRYDDRTKKELLKILGYIPEKNLMKQDIRLLIFVKEYTQYIKANYSYSSIDTARCNSQRKQRYIFQNDLQHLRNKIDVSIAENITELLWVNKERSLSRLNDGRYLLTQVKEFDDNNIKPFENAFSEDILELINISMSPMTYYLYRKDTDLVKNLNIERNLDYKYQYYYSMDDLIFLRLLIGWYDRVLNVNKDFLKDTNIEFDRLEKFDTVYWSHINYKSGDRNYVLYKTKDGIYTLVKFSIRIENDNIVLKWPKIYLSDTYEDIINWCLTFEEYSRYVSA
jgi:hypothetical protein